MLKILMAALFIAFSVTTQASAPLSKITTPGFYRFMLGDFEVTALSDGMVAYTII